MMKNDSLSRLKAAVRAATEEYSRVSQAMNEHPDVIAARKELGFALSKAKLLNASNERRAYARVIRAREAVQLAEQRNRSPEIEELFRQFNSGIDYGTQPDRWLVRWVSDNRRFFIFTMPSASCWSGIGCPRSYVPTTHYLIDMRAKAPKDFRGVSFFNHKLMVKREGRFTKALLAELVAMTSKRK